MEIKGSIGEKKRLTKSRITYEGDSKHSRSSCIIYFDKLSGGTNTSLFCSDAISLLVSTASPSAKKLSYSLGHFFFFFVG